MGFFSGIENAKATKGGVYFEPGTYNRLRVVEACMIRTRPPKNEDMLVIEFEILESSVPSRPVGSKVSNMFKVTQDSFQGNVKAWLAALYGTTEEQITEAVSEMSLNRYDAGGRLVQKGTAIGREVRAEAQIVKTRAGGDFTRVLYSPVQPVVQATA